MTQQRRAGDGDSVDETVRQGAALRRAGHAAEAEVLLQAVRREWPRHAAALHQLGLVRSAQSDFVGAVGLLRAAVELQPADASWINDLANALCQSGDLMAAVAQYERALEINPRFAQCHCNLFDQYAPMFDQHLVGTLGYDIPNLLARLLANGLGSNAPQADILDLGCGTGLFGVAAKPWCHSLVGVDVSPGMLAVAASKSACEDLVAADLLDHLRACDGDAFNAIVAADVLCTLGDLTELFEQAHRVCRAGGIFGFSVENDPLATADYGLRSTGRFAHSAGYIRALAQRFGFAEREANPVTVRFENGSPVTGLVFLLVKPS